MELFSIVIFLVLLISGECQSSCVYTPILSGVTPLQSLGEGMKQHVPDSADCKKECAETTSFTCTAFLWPADGGDCYLYDKINLEQEIFRDPMDAYVMYVQVCDGDSTPSVGFCEFTLEQTGISGASGSISPGIAAESSCREFCIARYQGPACNAYIVSPDINLLSSCLLYETTPTDLESGNVNLYVKTCSPPPCKFPIAVLCSLSLYFNCSELSIHYMVLLGFMHC